VLNIVKFIDQGISEWSNTFWKKQSWHLKDLGEENRQLNRYMQIWA